LLIECQQEIPACIESFKPDVQFDHPLFEDDNDNDDDDDDNDAISEPFNAPPVSQGASWDAGDNSVFQGDAFRTNP
jgi:hypothetical protein